MLVGDAKQAIYRWRGGVPEQFMQLYEDDNPFYINKEVVNLDTNYRSYSEIIEFNNTFFSYLSNYFVDDIHRHLYVVGNKQKENDLKGGYVQLDFIDNDKEVDGVELYQNKVLDIINNAIEKGFNLSDISVITRKKKEGVIIADFLIENDIAILSSESLLINNSCLLYTSPSPRD